VPEYHSSCCMRGRTGSGCASRRGTSRFAGSFSVCCVFPRSAASSRAGLVTGNRGVAPRGAALRQALSRILSRSPDSTGLLAATGRSPQVGPDRPRLGRVAAIKEDGDGRLASGPPGAARLGWVAAVACAGPGPGPEQGGAARRLFGYAQQCISTGSGRMGHSNRLLA
jgi:hypothetical protein